MSLELNGEFRCEHCGDTKILHIRAGCKVLCERCEMRMKPTKPVCPAVGERHLICECGEWRYSVILNAGMLPVFMCSGCGARSSLRMGIGRADYVGGEEQLGQG